MIRPAREKNRRRRVLVVTTCSPRPVRAVQRARLCAITCIASQAALAAKRPDGMWFRPTPYLEGLANGVLDLGVTAMMASSSSISPSPVGDEAVIAVGGEEGQLGTGRRLHPPDDEPHRRGAGLTLEGGVGGLSHIGGAVHPVWDATSSPSSGMASIRFRRLLCWRMVMEKRTSSLRQTDTTLWV